MEKIFLEIIKELNYPPIFLIPPEQFEMIEGDKIDNSVYGIAADHYPVISLNPDTEDETVLRNTIWHELAHHLWPWKPHWWIECFGYVMAGGGGAGFYSHKYGHSPDELPPRGTLLKMARRQAEKLKVRYKTTP